MLINRAPRAFLLGELGKHRRSGIQFVHKHWIVELMVEDEIRWYKGHFMSCLSFVIGSLFVSYWMLLTLQVSLDISNSIYLDLDNLNVQAICWKFGLQPNLQGSQPWLMSRNSQGEEWGKEWMLLIYCVPHDTSWCLLVFLSQLRLIG